MTAITGTECKDSLWEIFFNYLMAGFQKNFTHVSDWPPGSVIL